MWSCDQSLVTVAFYLRKVIITLILYGFDQKKWFFEWWSWFKFNNLGLALGTNLKFYINVAKGLKLKVWKFLWLNPTFVEVTEEKLVGGPFPPSWIGLEDFINPQMISMLSWWGKYFWVNFDFIETCQQIVWVCLTILWYWHLKS